MRTFREFVEDREQPRSVISAARQITPQKITQLITDSGANTPEEFNRWLWEQPQVQKVVMFLRQYQAQKHETYLTEGLADAWRDAFSSALESITKFVVMSFVKVFGHVVKGFSLGGIGTSALLLFLFFTSAALLAMGAPTSVAFGGGALATMGTSWLLMWFAKNILEPVVANFA